MGWVTTATMIGVTMFALPAHASDEWLNFSTSSGCAIDGVLDEANGPVAVALSWNRDATEPSVFWVRQRPKSFGRGGSISIESPSLDQPLTLTAEQEFAARGPPAEALMTDIASAAHWSLVLHSADGSERQVVPRLEDGARVFAMFHACRGFAMRAATPDDGQRRARTMHVSVSGTACTLGALYGPRGQPFGFVLVSRDGITKLTAGHPDESAYLDLSSFGVAADSVDPRLDGIVLSDAAAVRLASDLVAGGERRVPLRDSSGSSTLIFGGPEFAIEAAMYKACIDVH